MLYPDRIAGRCEGRALPRRNYTNNGSPRGTPCNVHFPGVLVPERSLETKTNCCRDDGGCPTHRRGASRRGVKWQNAPEMTESGDKGGGTGRSHVTTIAILNIFESRPLFPSRPSQRCLAARAAVGRIGHRLPESSGSGPDAGSSGATRQQP